MNIPNPQTIALYGLADTAHDLLDRIAADMPITDDMRDEINEWQAAYWAAAEHAAKSVIEG